jgi:transposase
VLEPFVAAGVSLRAIAAELGVSYTTVRHWLGRYGLQTRRPGGRRPEAGAEVPAAVVSRQCKTHGLTAFVREGKRAHYRCRLCRQERVAARRRAIKEILIREAGGACALCGYDRFAGALQFHHVDPTTKSFGIAANGVARSLEACREEARKCVLLCGNCHAEIEWGFKELAASLP